ncbi:MAG: hypothetical protein HYY35_00320, partial [Deltaproteobacteria bacterium]|nr:hypothetical protein [Deltaproteobacteria bacterium]
MLSDREAKQQVLQITNELFAMGLMTATLVYANAASSSSIAFIWPPEVDDGTRIGVFTPAATQAS